MITFEKIEKAAEMEDLTERAKKHFGTTNDPYEAGYITHTGHMLDFSGKKQNPSDRTLSGGRHMEHNEIQGMEGIRESGQNAIDEFQSKANAIRFHASSQLKQKYRGGINLQFHHDNKPTAHQWNALHNIHNKLGNPQILYDISGKDSGVVDSVDQLKSRFIGKSVLHITLEKITMMEDILKCL